MRSFAEEGLLLDAALLHWCGHVLITNQWLLLALKAAGQHSAELMHGCGHMLITTWQVAAACLQGCMSALPQRSCCIGVSSSYEQRVCRTGTTLIFLAVSCQQPVHMFNTCHVYDMRLGLGLLLLLCSDHQTNGQAPACPGLAVACKPARLQ